MKLLMKKVNGKLVPCYESDREKMNKVKDVVSVDIKQPRNLGFHRKFFSLINLAFENQSLTNNIDIFRKAVTIEAGFTQECIRLDGEIVMDARSISFSSMDQDEFEDLYSRVLDVIIKFLEVDESFIEEELINYM